MIKVCLTILFSFSICAFAQDRNMLAKIAFEDAETAFAAGKIAEAEKELNAVDSLLGKVTPKSQYLRVQIWVSAMNKTPTIGWLKGALTQCKAYFDLAKVFDIPEDKLMDVTRSMVKFEKEVPEAEKRQKAAEEQVKAITAFKDSLLLKLKYKPGLSEAEFIKQNPESVLGLKREAINPTTNAVSYKSTGAMKASGASSLLFNNDVVLEYTYCIVGEKAEESYIKSIFDGYSNKVKATFPANMVIANLNPVIDVYFSMEDGLTYRFRFTYMALSYYNKKPQIHISLSTTKTVKL